MSYLHTKFHDNWSSVVYEELRWQDIWTDWWTDRREVVASMENKSWYSHKNLVKKILISCYSGYSNPENSIYSVKLVPTKIAHLAVSEYFYLMLHLYEYFNDAIYTNVYMHAPLRMNDSNFACKDIHNGQNKHRTSWTLAQRRNSS